MTGRRFALAPLALLVAATPAGGRAGDAAKGREKAGPCSACHGPLGLSTQPDAPNLAGQPAEYMVQQLRAYRSGKRSHEVMTLMAKPLSDADIADLAAWYASLKVKVEEPGKR